MLYTNVLNLDNISQYLKYILCGNSQPIKAASKSHSPKRCNIVLHFARPGARGDLGSDTYEVNAAKELIQNMLFQQMKYSVLFINKNTNYLQEILDVEDGPEFVVFDGGGTAEVLLVVKPIREVLGIPKERSLIHKIFTLKQNL